jgi:dTDP-4-amino-4,6-dideoxygalactose transaminase
LIKFLAESADFKKCTKDINSVSYYSVPLQLQPVFENLEHKEGDFPVAEKVSNQCLSLACVSISQSRRSGKGD